MAETGGYKTEIFLRLFQKRWNAKTRKLSRSVVYSTEVRLEYEEYQKRRGLKVENTNPPAFMKDFLRVRRRANLKWPPEIFAAGYTARQVTGEGRNFEFIPVLPGQSEPFPSTAPTPPPDSVPHKISSVGMPLASRRLGRTDEPWLVQVSVRLHVVETYFALFSARKATIRQIDHLQNSLKLNRTEIDALFLGIEETPPGFFHEFMITCEAKRVGEDIITEQVLAQAKAVFTLANVTQPFVVPIALKAIGPSKIHVVEYQEVTREDAEELETLNVINQAVFELVPPVPGIGRRGLGRSITPTIDDL
jgi:hypothetical protein